MGVLLFTDDVFLRHDTGPGHPERPERLAAITDGVHAGPSAVDVRSPRAATAADLGLVHEPHYIDLIERFAGAGGGELDRDTVVSQDSWQAALLAAGSGLSAIEALRHDEGTLAVCAVRPPGHHARPESAMGFCLFNNVAVAAAALVGGGERVAIVDWDVHHGNGTQEMFFESPDVLFVSIHEWGPDPVVPAVSFYPGSGWFDEVGSGNGKGTTVNVPVPAATSGDVYRQAFADIVTPALERFGADWLLVSSGYDAHAADPLAHVGLEASDYLAMAAALPPYNGRTILFAEGGYDLAAVTESMTAVLAGFDGAAAAAPSGSSPATAWRLLEGVKEAATGSGALP